MKVFFDTNVYVAEAILGQAAERLIEATERAAWRIYCTGTVLDEIERVLVGRLGVSRRFAVLTRLRIARRSTLIAAPASRHTVPNDPKDSPILAAALAAGTDYLVTNDRHLLALNPYEGVQIVSMDRFYRILRDAGLLA